MLRSREACRCLVAQATVRMPRNIRVGVAFAASQRYERSSRPGARAIDLYVARDTRARSRQRGAVRAITLRQGVAVSPKVAVVSDASTTNGASN